MIVPVDYQKLDPLPEDPEGCVSYGKQTENALCMVSIYPIDPEDAMDFNDKKALIDGIHHTLDENQALIEVENGRRISGFPYIYSIVKTYNGEEDGVGYTLVLDFLLRPNRGHFALEYPDVSLCFSRMALVTLFSSIEMLSAVFSFVTSTWSPFPYNYLVQSV